MSNNYVGGDVLWYPPVPAEELDEDYQALDVWHDDPWEELDALAIETFDEFNLEEFFKLKMSYRRARFAWGAVKPWLNSVIWEGNKSPAEFKAKQRSKRKVYSERAKKKREAQSDEWQEQYRIDRNARQREYYADNKEKIALRSKEWRRKKKLEQKLFKYIDNLV